MREEPPDGLVVFAMWEKEDGIEVDKFISVEVESELHHRGFIKKAWILFNEYIDKMNKDMANSGDHTIIIEQDMLEWRVGIRRN